MNPDICIHHAPCADGFTAAWAIRSRWPDIEFHPGVYGEAPPDVRDKNVLIVDFSYKRPVLVEMGKTARSITVLDHHKSAQADLEGFPNIGFGDPGDGNIQTYFNMDKSGARLAWEYAQPNREAPMLVKYVEDRDLWKFTIPGTREVAAEIFSHPYDFAEWDALAAKLETDDGRRSVIEAGEAIERKHHKDCAELLAISTREMLIGGFRVPVANIPYTMSSDAANTLAEGHPFGACYYDNSDGKRVFSLRSKPEGEDVSLVAVGYGGGGHARAAGFTAPRGWEGE